LRYRGRVDDVDDFNVSLASISSAEDSSRIEDVMAHLSVFDSMTTLLTEFGDYISKPKLLNYLMEMIGMNISDVASPSMQKIVDDIFKGKEIKTPKTTPEDEFAEEDLGDEEVPEEDMGDEEVPEEDVGDEEGGTTKPNVGREIKTPSFQAPKGFNVNKG
jgi:hypothetical protein